MFRLNMDTFFTYLALSGFLIGSVHSELCTNQNRDDIYFHCDSCCGSWPYENCCNTGLVGVIVGCVLGGIFLVGVGVCIVFVCVKQKGRSGRVIQPAGIVQPPMHSTTVAYTVPYPQPGMVQPPAYPQQGIVQPPAYPPPAFPPPEHPPNNQNVYGHPAPALPEGIQSQPPASGGLPGNHKLV